MGKYIRKPKTSGDLAVKDVSQSFLGVRTRAKTLALQRLPSSAASAVVADASSPPKSHFLELRSRRLEKPPLPINFQNSRKNPAAKEYPQFENSESSPEPAALTIELDGKAGERFGRLQGGDSEMEDPEIQASSGGKNLDARGRGTRESTPCSFIQPAYSVLTPGSSARPRSPNPMSQSVRRDIHIAREVEEFFAQAEQLHQRRFLEKYNFDIVNDVALTGRYEWVKVLP